MTGANDSPEDLTLFGRLAIEAGLATLEEVRECLKLQANGDRRRLGELLVEQGVMRPEDVVRIVRVQLERRSAGADDRRSQR